MERDALRRDSVRATDEIVAALNERRIALAFEPVVETKSRKIAFYECLMRVHRADGRIAHANEIIPVAERVGLMRMLDYRVLELVVERIGRRARSARPASTSRRLPPSIRTGGRGWARCCAPIPARPRG